MMLSKTSTILRTMSSPRAFSTSTARGTGAPRKMQKLFIDYLDDAQRRKAASVKKTASGRNASSSTSPTTKSPEPAVKQPKPQRKMQKLFLDYLDDAQRKIDAQKKTQSK